MTDSPARICPVCTKPFPPRRRPGGKPKEHCSPACRHNLRKARTAFTAALEAAGVVSIAEVIAALGDQPPSCHAHWGTKQ